VRKISSRFGRVALLAADIQTGIGSCGYLVVSLVLLFRRSDDEGFYYYILWDGEGFYYYELCSALGGKIIS